MKRIKVFHLLILLLLLFIILNGYYDKYLLCQIIDFEYRTYHSIGKNIYERLLEYKPNQSMSKEDINLIFDYLNKLIYIDYSLDMVSINEGRRAYFFGRLLQNELDSKGLSEGDYPLFYKLLNNIKIDISNEEKLTIDNKGLIALKEISYLIMNEYDININLLSPKYMLIRPYNRVNEESIEIYKMYYND
ncbi:hypothetical protein [Tepidimicrobium xylanilyticum]|uniref:Uncharacterized protein n=1 Tax=Tepidimicrobium xylanilyticum TaxID=1123352 RepID=A0A1H2ZG02_9FIRM|nr:hypothetical protein [Tepidimicrobium xylanilyticum]SDX15714.1 hypothetical protein SAMN05660923_01809 [Tepidimicrobium xylanilyticum]